VGLTTAHHKREAFYETINRASDLDGFFVGWRKLCNGELHNLYSSPSKIRIIK
jgi:hypothetical protein